MGLARLLPELLDHASMKGFPRRGSDSGLEKSLLVR